MKQITCAIAVLHGKNVLLAHPTNAGKFHSWSLPKGIMDPGETYAQAALRELFEETGVDFRHREAEVVSLGTFAYRPHKDYHLCVLRVSEPIDLAKCVCESYFIHNEQEHPEVDGFAVVEVDLAVGLYLNKGQAALVNTHVLNLI